MMKLKGRTDTGVVKVEGLSVSAYQIPTDAPEADGTLAWTSTTLVLVELHAAGETGIGFTYAAPATAVFIEQELRKELSGRDVFDVPGAYSAMLRLIRNNGECGIAMCAVSAIDVALWDLKAKLLGLPLYRLLGSVKEAMAIYGSGGFTSYSKKQLQDQLAGWVADGIGCVKMKVGSHPQLDEERVKQARAAIGPQAELFVDANGAYTAQQALEKAKMFSDCRVTWFEEPVSSDNLRDLAFIRGRVPVGMRIAAGEYGYNLPYFHSMLASGAVDVLQADATRCGGISGFLRAGILCEGNQVPFSSHCAPSLHLHAALSLPAFTVAEYFHDHVRIEKMLFDGTPLPSDGVLRPDPVRPGLGLEFKHRDAAPYKL
jgi:L-alanine-DL-glutamate epimerase-like enolase superfamily enzyme